MVFETFKKAPFKERLKDTGFLIKNSFTIVTKDKDIKTPTIHMVVLSTIITIFIYLGILLTASGTYLLFGIPLLLIALFILIPYRFFYNVRQKADQSWIVYNTICGKDISYADAHTHTKSQKSKLTLIAFIDLVMAYVKTQRGIKKGIIGTIIKLFLSFLDEVWDLLSHYMLPAVVIEQKPLKEIISEMKALKTNVPATLAGVFGIDFVGAVIGSLFFGIYFVAILLSVGVGYLVAMFTEITVITLGPITFSWVPVFATLFIISIISGIYKTIIASIKVIYFTIFYTSIMRPTNIKGGMKDELTHYLLMKESDFKVTEVKPKLNEHDKYIKQLSDYIKQFKTTGHAQEEAVTLLKSKGHSDANIDEAIRKIV